MNKQMERDLKRRKAEEERERRRRERYAKIPEYKGLKPRTRILYPVVVIFVEAENLINKVFYWSEERGKKFLSHYWMRAVDWDEDEKIYYFDISTYYLYNWSAIVKNPIIKKWARNNQLQINKLWLDSNWTPLGFKKTRRSGDAWYACDSLEFKPIQED